MWDNQAAHDSASTDLAPAFSRILLLELPPQRTVKASRLDLQHEMCPIFGALPRPRGGGFWGVMRRRAPESNGNVMAKRRIPMAITYDFDGTLAAGNM